MELEFDLKIARTRDNLTSSVRITEDCDPLFQSKETEIMFILIGYLSGFKKDRIEIAINEAGTEITISGEKYFQEMVMVRWQMCLKDVEIKRFRKVFRVPAGVVLDGIEAKFDEEDAILYIYMPKWIKAENRGIKIQEVKEEEIDNGRSSTMQSEEDDGISSTTQLEDVKEEEIDDGRSSTTQPKEEIYDGRSCTTQPEPVKEETDDDKSCTMQPIDDEECNVVKEAVSSEIDEPKMEYKEDQVGSDSSLGLAETSDAPNNRHENGSMPDLEHSPLESEEIPATPTTEKQDTGIKATEPEEDRKPYQPGTADSENTREIAETSETSHNSDEKGSEVISPMDQTADIEHFPVESVETPATPTMTTQYILQAMEPEEGRKPNQPVTADSENSPFETAESPLPPTTKILQDPDQETLILRDIKQEPHQPDTTDPQKSPSGIVESPIIPTTKTGILYDPDLETLKWAEFGSEPIPNLAETLEQPSSVENQHQTVPEIKIPEHLETPAKPDETVTDKQEFSESKHKIPEEAQEHENSATKITDPAPKISEQAEIQPNQELHGSEPDLTSSQQHQDREQLREVESKPKEVLDRRVLPKETLDLESAEKEIADEEDFQESENEEEQKRRWPFRSPNICTGSAFIISLIALVVHLLRRRQQRQQ